MNHFRQLGEQADGENIFGSAALQSKPVAKKSWTMLSRNQPQVYSGHFRILSLLLLSPVVSLGTLAHGKY